jgi:hypothetical protein
MLGSVTGGRADRFCMAIGARGRDVLLQFSGSRVLSLFR